MAPILTQALFLFYFLPNQNNMANHPSQYSNSIATRPLECFDKDISLLQLYKQDFVNLDFPIFIGFTCMAKLYIPSTLNTDYLLWHTQLIVCAVKY